MTLWACLCAGDILLSRGPDGYALPAGDEAPVALQPWNKVTTLRLPAAACDALHVVRLDRPVTGSPGLEMMALRASFDVLSERDYALAGKAAELIYWDHNSKYCGCCGAPMRFETEISKRCTECGKELWPQLATAIIVRITRSTSSSTHDAGDEAILLVHANNFRRPYYGLVAGFVETGESLEEAVRREVREETGLEITDIRYFGSQPWPYPCGLMVGFTARYAAGEIHLQRSELSSGGWFTRADMPPIPGKSSIARRLIDDWLCGGATTT
ncbi:MAG: NAD(+) diphosphatase [Bacteroidaceae bacterium]|nr:NAD(+) diphosphatase [Bacteroidaceae bacterium]